LEKFKGGVPEKESKETEWGGGSLKTKKMNKKKNSSLKANWGGYQGIKTGRRSSSLNKREGKKVKDQWVRTAKKHRVKKPERLQPLGSASLKLKGREVREGPPVGKVLRDQMENKEEGTDSLQISSRCALKRSHSRGNHGGGGKRVGGGAMNGQLKSTKGKKKGGKGCRDISLKPHQKQRKGGGIRGGQEKLMPDTQWTG